MSVLSLAGPGHLSRLLPMVAACHDEAGRASTDSRRRLTLEPLLRGTPLGAVWLVGPRMPPAGYLAVGFSWSLAAAGPVAQLDEIWLRPEARAQGLGGKALDELAIEAQKRGAVAVCAVVPPEPPRLATFLARRGYFRREGDTISLRRL